MSGDKTGPRVTFALLCGLAICCSVMYLTADGQEAILTEEAADQVTIGQSVNSKDIQKAGQIYTNTPDGRMRLKDYFRNVEMEISQEESERKADVEAVKNQMARNFAFNQNARKKMKKMLLAKMAENAKKCHDDLETSMAHVQAEFAKAAKLQNERNDANKARTRALKAEAEKNKQEAKKNLQTAVVAQQKAMAALKSQVNEHIDQTDKAVAKNAAQIKDNAKAAADALSAAVSKFDKKVATAREDAAKGRAGLATQLQDQDKSIRQYANDKLKTVIAKTGEKFGKVRQKMAEDRQHADLMLKSASTRMTASLNAFTAMNDKHFTKTMGDIATAKKEASDRIDAASTHFKSKILELRATVNEQVTKTQARITQLSGKVTKNKLAQAKINQNVEAEQKRMMKIGNDRYQEHLNKDAALKDLIDKNKQATDARLAAMSSHYTQELDSVRAEMKKNRAHASKMLAKKSATLYSAIEAHEKAQLKVNGELIQQTRDAALDIADSLRNAKSDFANGFGALHATVIQNDKKFEAKLDKLTGIVRADAVKNKEGREAIESVQKANKAELNKAVSDAIHTGEQRMMAAEAKIKDQNAKTKAALNMRITSEISKQTKRANGQIEGLRLSSAEARAEMQKELLYAIRSAAEEAKSNLEEAVKKMAKDFDDAEEKEKQAVDKEEEERTAIATSIAFQKEQATQGVKDATSTMEKSFLSLQTETRKKIKKTNRKIRAYGDQLEKESEDIKALMSSTLKTLTAEIQTAKKDQRKQIHDAGQKSKEDYVGVMDQVEATLTEAAELSDKKFADMYSAMAKNRGEVEDNLSASVKSMNANVAKQAALFDSRFSDTVKDIKAARDEATEAVSNARKEFSTALVQLTSSVKDQETRLLGDIQVVSGVHLSNQAEQNRINRRTKAEHARILKLSNENHSSDKRARGKLRKILDENKRAAEEAVGQLAQLFNTNIQKIRERAADNSLDAAQDLTEASKKLYGELATVQLKAAYDNDVSAANIAKYEADAADGIQAAKDAVDSSLSQLTNTVVGNAKSFENKLSVLTGVVHNFESESAADIVLLNKQANSMQQDMQARITRAIQKGETAAKRVADRARKNLDGMKQSMLIEITERVEATAEELYAAIQQNHQTIADNYISLKAYAVAGSSGLEDYVGKGKGRNLSSLGDLLMSIGATSDVVVEAAEGLGMGISTIPAVFSNKALTVDNTVSKVNGLVNEYTRITAAVRARWPQGLGKYLLLKLEGSMLKKGVLQVSKVEGKPGNFVFIDGNGVGLSNKMSDFEALAVKMSTYEATLAKLTAMLTAKPPQPVKPTMVTGPEWQGE